MEQPSVPITMRCICNRSRQDGEIIFGPNQFCPLHGNIERFALLLGQAAEFLKELEERQDTPIHTGADISQFRGEILGDWR